jgi:hypothetical protein
MVMERDDGCRYCEQERRGGWIFCRSCGRRLTADDRRGGVVPRSRDVARTDPSGRRDR